MKEQKIVMEGAYAKQYADWQVKTGGYAKDMTMRDHYAGLAMQGFAARDTHDAGLASPEQRAKLAYMIADAMLKERVK
jgi:hypothetical protein